MKHCVQHHKNTLDALARLIEENPKDEAKFACDEYIQNMQPPDGAASLVRFLGKGSKETSNELLVLAWFLDANISFNQFDNELFKQLIRDLNGRSFPSSTTIVERVLPVLYRYATEYEALSSKVPLFLHVVRRLDQEQRAFYFGTTALTRRRLSTTLWPARTTTRRRSRKWFSDAISRIARIAHQCRFSALTRSS